MSPVPRSHPGFSAVPQAVGPARNWRVLIVEDHEDTRFMLRHFIENSGFEVLEAGDGETALKLARVEQPDLILIDLSLPGRDGASVIESLRTDEKGKSVPILVMSGRMESELTPASATVGYDEYLMKPLDLDHLLSTIRWRLHEYASREK